MPQKNRKERLEYLRQYYQDNKEYIKGQKKEYRDKTRHIARGREIKKKYGLELEEVIEILKEQKSLCVNKDCGNELHWPSRDTHIDHNHITDKIRGILCRDCNVALGMLKDNPAILRGLAEYLEAHE